jgi:RHH-type rel operon transcriptional repressor/antitoxin RelB
LEAVLNAMLNGSAGVPPAFFAGGKRKNRRQDASATKNLSFQVNSLEGDDLLYLYSEVYMLAIRLPQAIEKRLEKLARRTGRTKTFYAREAILQHLEDFEDIYLAERTLRRIRGGKEQTVPLKNVLKRHGLED